MLRTPYIILSLSLLASTSSAKQPREPELQIQMHAGHPLTIASTGGKLQWKHDVPEVRNAGVSWPEDHRYTIALTRQDGSVTILRTDHDLGWRNDFFVTWEHDGSAWSRGAIDWISLSPTGHHVCLIEEPGRCVIVSLGEEPTVHQIPAIGFTLKSKVGAGQPDIPSAEADSSEWNGMSASRLPIRSVHWSDDETGVYISYVDGRVLLCDMMRPYDVHVVRTPTWNWSRRVLTQSAWSKLSSERGKNEQETSVAVNVSAGGIDASHSIIGCSDGSLVLKKGRHMLCMRATTGEDTWHMEDVYEARCVGKYIIAALQTQGELSIVSVDINTGATLLKRLLPMHHSPEIIGTGTCVDCKSLTHACLLSAFNTQHKSRKTGMVFITKTSTTMSLNPAIELPQNEEVLDSVIRATSTEVRYLTVTGSAVRISTIPVSQVAE